MEGAAAVREHLGAACNSKLSPARALYLAAWIGLAGGYFDLAMIFLKRDALHLSLYYEQGRFFRWVVPLAALLVMLIPGLLVAAVSCFRPALVGPRRAVWLFATIALWGPLLRFPLYGVATLLLAAGAARAISGWVARHILGSRWIAPLWLAALSGVVAVTAVTSVVGHTRAESRAVASLSPPPPHAANVLLIVMDTVRAESLGLYGHHRDTSPQLSRWSAKGVRFDWAFASAPWTFPSHCSFMTGQWPSTLNAHWQPTLDATYPTLADFLTSRGFLTAGFAANTYWCSYESGMNRGFVHYEDYPLTPGTVLASTMPGRWLLSNLRSPRDYYSVKWIRAQSRDARGINNALLDWLSHSRSNSERRPFFAFLNYLDAHEPFLPPEGDQVRFGLRAQSQSDYTMLLDYWDWNKLSLTARDVELARDSYENCIAALDREIGSLLDELDRRDMLKDTHIIITSDHGEQFGEHGVFNHGYSVYSQEVHVPLIVISPEAQPGQVCGEPVSLRDIPATVVDLVGLGNASPFPGRSLALRWKKPEVSYRPRGSMAISEVDIPLSVPPERGKASGPGGFTVSLADAGLHYVLGASPREELYDLAADPKERNDLMKAPAQDSRLGQFRSAIRQLILENRDARGTVRSYMERLARQLDAMNARTPG
jgi:arylsulfatase A-like enzyme